MRCDMLHRVDIDADAATVYRAITTAEGQRSFWTPDADLEPTVGSIARFGFEAAPVDLEIRIEQLDKPKRVVWSCQGGFPYWTGSMISWDIQPGLEGKGVRVLFRHGDWKEEYPDEDWAGVNWTWGFVLLGLKRYAETGSPDPALR